MAIYLERLPTVFDKDEKQYENKREGRLLNERNTERNNQKKEK